MRTTCSATPEKGVLNARSKPQLLGAQGFSYNYFPFSYSAEQINKTTEFYAFQNVESKRIFPRSSSLRLQGKAFTDFEVFV